MDDFTFAAFCLLATLVFAACFQQGFVLPRLRREVELLNVRRAERAAQALAASSSSDWEALTQIPQHAFAAWVQLLDDGTLSVAGQRFSLQQTFQVNAKDQRRISRATVTCSGTGEALITSHGQMHRVRFLENQWSVELADSP